STCQILSLFLLNFASGLLKSGSLIPGLLVDEASDAFLIESKNIPFLIGSVFFVGFL
ncbi:hypothetical protein Ancab_010820, partial [Ancistrocladus abbreviatus]